MPPWSLTTADGAGLALKRVDATAVLQGPLAFTELHLYFHNPEDRMREGRFEITLPPRAAISRFAMKDDRGAWMEAEVVEKMRAREAYETFLHRRQDPALLEQTAGNQFTARVFPIGPRSDKHLVISFSQELRGDRYVLPLRGLPKVPLVDVRLRVRRPDGRPVQQVLSEIAWRPDRDFVATAAVSGGAGAGPLVAAEFTALDARGAASVADAPSGVTLLVDTSASRSLGFGRTIRAARELIAALGARHGAELRVEVYAYDQTTQRIFRGRADDWSKEHEDALAVRGAAGASDLGQAFAALAAQQPLARVVLLTDGVVTAGSEGAELAAAARRVGGVERFDVLLTGGIRDPQLAEVIASAGARPGAVIDLERGAGDAAAALGERMLTGVAIEVPGAAWSYPKVIPAIRAGARVVVYARLHRRTRELAALVNGHRQIVRISDGSQALLERAIAVAEIGELEQRLAAGGGDDALRAEIVRRSVAERVVSSQTSLLVLESEADYPRFGIDRRALVDILEIAEDGKLVERHRAASAIPAMPPRTREERAIRPPAQQITVAGSDPIDAPRIERLELNMAAPSVVVDAAQLMPRMAGEAIVVIGGRDSDKIPMAGSLARHHRYYELRRTDYDDDDDEPEPEPWPPRDAPPALRGELAEIMRDPRSLAALTRARAWHLRDPGNVLALVGMGEVLEARGQLPAAARMYGSIIDLFPGRADLRRFAGERLERVGAVARALAIDTYRRAVADRPDHLTGHRLLAYALLRAGRHAEALDAIFVGYARRYPPERFAGGGQVLAQDAALIGAAYAAAVPERRTEITGALAQRGLAIDTEPSTRIVLYWETDANDVDLHVQDRKGGHAGRWVRQLPSGGELINNVTTGYGPELFVIRGKAKAGPYKVSLSYASQGAMGYGMGLVQIIHHDGHGRLAFDDRPYVIMSDGAYVDLGRY